MSSTTIKFEEGDAPVRVTPGRHTFQVTGWTKKYSANKGTPYIELVARSLAGAKHTESLYCTEKAFWKFAQVFKACGLKWPSGTALDVALLGEIMIGRSFEATTDYKVNATSGKKYIKVSEWHDAGSYESPAIPTEPAEGAEDDDVPF